MNIFIHFCIFVMPEGTIFIPRTTINIAIRIQPSVTKYNLHTFYYLLFAMSISKVSGSISVIPLSMIIDAPWQM